MASGCGQKGSRVLTPEQQQEVFRHQAAIAELLRHFWSCFPARTPQLEAKVSAVERVSLYHLVSLTGTQDAAMLGGVQ